MKTKTLFKVNQTVYDSALFVDLEGKVIDDSNGSIYPIIVEFGDEGFAYTYDGRFDASANPTLTDQLYKVEYVPPQPQIEFPEVGQWCWFWDDEFVGYYFGQFVSFNENDELQYIAANNLKYQHCSTTNPIENEKHN